MRILVTGAGGMLASAFERVLTSSPIHTAVFCVKEDCDITKPESVAIALEREKPNILINTAAYNGVDSAETNPDAARRLNAFAVQVLAKECLQRRITMVHYSTDYVFDGSQKEGYCEGDPPHPLSVYGQTKRDGEVMLEDYGGRGLAWYCIRTSRLFGPPGTSSESKKSFPQLVMDRLHGGEPLECIDGEVSSPTLVDDLADASIFLIQAHLPFGYYHRTNDGACTWYEFGSAIIELLSHNGIMGAGIRKAVSTALQRPAKRPAYSVLKTTKLPHLRNWRDALEQYLNHV